MKPEASRTLPCPCCGSTMDLDAGRCECGARFVGEPVLEPSTPQPMYGAAAASLAFSLLSPLAVWFRPFAVLAPVAVVLGVRAVRNVRRDPARYGGRRVATTGLALASVFTLVACVYLVSRIPRVLEERREAAAAGTRAEMYHVAGLIHEYHATFGAYPERLSDLARVEKAAPREVRDSWQRKMLYAGYTSGIAATAGALTLNANFELRSVGPDGVPNTADDIVMRDGSIVDLPEAASPAPAPLPVSAPVTKRGR